MKMNWKSCLNWKVIGGLVLVAVGLWIVAPGVAARALPLLLVAACPLSMLLMLGGMAGMGKKMSGAATAPPVGNGTPALVGPGGSEQLSTLQARLQDLAAQQDEVARQLAELDDTPDGVDERGRTPVLRLPDR